MISEAHQLPGGVTLAVDTDAPTWSVATITGDLWFDTDDAAVSGSARYYSPDGELLVGEHSDTGAAAGWRMGHSGTTLDLATDVVVFSARAYVPELGLFTTTDPVAHAGPTPYAYADNDPVNLVDPTGWSSEGWFDDWNSPGTVMVVTYALTLLALLLSFLGPVGMIGGAILMLIVAGYQVALGVDAYLAGNVELAAVYWVNAGISLAFVVGFAWDARGAIIKARSTATNPPPPPISVRPPGSTRPLTGSTGPMNQVRGTNNGLSMNRQQLAELRASDRINLRIHQAYGGAPSPATAASPFIDHAINLLLPTFVMGVGLLISGILGYYDWAARRMQ
ncbi:MAG: RHS repeat-associated core domain-containing protein [Actinomycetota bacterium]